MEEDTCSPGWSASFFMQTTEDIARAVAAAAATATATHPPRPSVVFSDRKASGSPLQKLRRNVSSFWGNWRCIQDHRSIKEPSKLFESMVVIGLHPNCDMQALHKRYVAKRPDNPGKLRNSLIGQHQSQVEPNLEPQVLFVYPPEKPLPLKYKDILSFCFPGGVEVHAVERTPSMSDLREVLLGYVPNYVFSHSCQTQ
ncbi:hypothetical protein MLD38_000023 [Melastoma candidum]|uniref:Uncharacterized protein n=1 Tax=Melastoma candidum TaxID=119954 RepID=A0ACB9S800_9MYRT|nr:hypothetical protein MLD38_000023 [Melastoma candidum]